MVRYKDKTEKHGLADNRMGDGGFKKYWRQRNFGNKVTQNISRRTEVRLYLRNVKGDIGW
jgi:hypothetical protein